MSCTAAMGPPKVLLSHPAPARSTSQLRPSIEMPPDVAAGPSSVLTAGGTPSRELTGPQPYLVGSPPVCPCLAPGETRLPFYSPLPYPTLWTGKSSQVPPGGCWPLRTPLRPWHPGCREWASHPALRGASSSLKSCGFAKALVPFIQSKLHVEYCTYTGFSLFFFLACSYCMAKLQLMILRAGSRAIPAELWNIP